MRFLIVIIFLLFTIASLNAQSSENIDSHAENSEHIVHNNHIALFLGGTTFFNKGENHFSVGLDYVYRPNVKNPWAYSIMVEAVFAEHTEYVVALPVYHYLIGEWWFRAGPGIEIIQEEDNHGDEVHLETHIEFLFRIGIGYSFYLGNILFSPSVDVDFVRNNDALIWGVNFGYSF